MLFRQIFDPQLAQYAYLVGCQATGEALLIDPERDADRYLRIAEEEGLRLTAVTETHIHADFLSGTRELAERTDATVYLSDEGDADWKYTWPRETRQDGSPYDVVLLQDGDAFTVGHIEIRAVHTPGHTPEHLSFLIIDRGSGATTPMGIATGDFVFVGDLGRPDLLEQAAGMHGVQENSARTLYRALPHFTGLEDYLQVWPGHGAGSTCGKALGAVPQSTVGYEKRYNASLAAADEGEDAFVDAILGGQPEPQMYFARMKRDNKEGVPVLGSLPQPRMLDADALGEVLQRDDVVVLDARTDRSAFMARHLPGALYAPLGKSFVHYVGSLLTDETAPLVLVADEGDVEEAVRGLIRIGYDRVEAFVAPAELHRHFDRGGDAEVIEEIDFDALADRRSGPETAVLDVRFASEYEAGHVPGAVNASYTRLPEYLEARVPDEQELLVHCGSGARAAAAAAYLARKGYNVAYVNDVFSHYAETYETDRGGADAVAA